MVAIKRGPRVKCEVCVLPVCVCVCVWIYPFWIILLDRVNRFMSLLIKENQFGRNRQIGLTFNHVDRWLKGTCRLTEFLAKYSVT